MKKLTTLLLIVASFAASAQIDLKYNLKKGQIFKILNVAKQDIEQEIMGQMMEINQSFSQGTKYEVLSVSGNESRIQCTYYRMAFEMASIAGNMSYDSQDPSSSESPLSMTFGSMIDKSFIITMNQTGEISKVEGMDQILNSILENSGLDEGSTDQLKMQLESQFGSEAIAKSMEQGFKFFPASGKVKKDEKWTYITNLGIYDIDVTNNYSLTSTDANSATISLNTSMESGEFSQNLNGQEVEMELSGNQSGSIKVDRKTGIILEGMIRQDLNAKATTMGMTIPMKIKATNTFSRED